MSEVYFSNSNLLIRSMEVDDAKIIYDTYLLSLIHISESCISYRPEMASARRRLLCRSHATLWMKV